MTPEQINEIIAGIDYHLKRIDEFSGKLYDVKTYLIQLQAAQENTWKSEFDKMKIEIQIISKELQKRGVPAASQYETLYQLVKDRVQSSNWPEAANKEEICDTNEKAIERASHILSFIVLESVRNKRFLDYGCGEGYVVTDAVARGATVAHGYDINSDQSKVGNLVTNYFDGIKNDGPYDIILAHDVLDHILKLNPIQALSEMKSVLASDGKIYVRCHPWSSRHGGHLYTQINKAFLHLAMDEIELMRLGGYKPEYNVRVVRPLETYRYWFNSAGLDIVSEMPCTTDVENYYFEPSPIRDRILQNWDGDEMAARENMKFDFVEYVLRHSPSNI